MDARLSTVAKIVQSPGFKSHIVKFQHQQEANSTKARKSELFELLLRSVDDVDETTECGSFIERVVEKLRDKDDQRLSGTLEKGFLPTSNLCERLFCTSKRALSIHREGIFLVNLECQHFIFMNCSLSGVEDVRKTVNK